MKIGILLHPYGEKERAGLGRAIFELTKAMIAAAPEREFLIFVKGNPPQKPEFPGTNWRLYPLGEGLFWLDRLHRAPPADIYLFNTPVLPHFWGRKSVVIAPDFAYLHFPLPGFKARVGRFLLRRRHSTAMRRAARVVAISEATRQDAIQSFCIAPEKVQTIHLGYNRICSIPEERFAVPGKFFLSVGVLKARKNAHTLIDAFARFYSRHPDFNLVFAGKDEGEYAARLRDAVLEQGLQGRIHFCGYRSEGGLAFLYRRAAALVYPSIVEGFGFPILEAMDCGTPVITSDQSSLAEIGGEAALLVDPHKPEDVARAMARIADEPGLREELIRRGSARKEHFSWGKAGQEFVARLSTIG